MSQNLLPNRPTQTTGYNSKFSAWTPTLTGSATAPTGTWSASSGPDSTPGLTLAASGTSGGVEALSRSFNVSTEQMIALSVVLAASSVVPTLTPWSITFKDANANTVLTVAAPAAVPASTSAIQYNTTVGVPDLAVSAQVIFGALSWASVGGYTVVMSSPNVSAL